MSEADEQHGDGEISVCHVCGESFPTRLELSQHLMDRHDDDGLP